MARFKSVREATWACDDLEVNRSDTASAVRIGVVRSACLEFKASARCFSVHCNNTRHALTQLLAIRKGQELGQRNTALFRNQLAFAGRHVAQHIAGKLSQTRHNRRWAHRLGATWDVGLTRGSSTRFRGYAAAAATRFRNAPTWSKWKCVAIAATILMPSSSTARTIPFATVSAEVASATCNRAAHRQRPSKRR